MKPWERFADKLQSSARGAAALGMAREALRGLDAMAANDPFVNSAQAQDTTRGGGRGHGSSRISSEAASGGGRSRLPHRRDRNDRSPPPASKVHLFIASEHQPHDDDDDDDDGDVQRHQPLEDVVHEARDPAAAVVTMADSASSSRRINARGSKGRGEGNEFVGGQGPRRLLALSRNGGDAAGAGADGNDNDVTLPTTAPKKEKSRQRFLDDLDEHVSRPMKPMNIETSNHTSTSNNGYESPGATGSTKWPTWLALSAPAILLGTSRADGSAGRSPPPPPPAPLLARASRTTKTDRANRSHDDPHQDDEYRVHSSAAMLGDEERAQLKALMGTTASSGDATSITAGDDAVRSSTGTSPALWRQRREAFVGATLVLLLLVYYWARDRVVPDD